MNIYPNEIGQEIAEHLAPFLAKALIKEHALLLFKEVKKFDLVSLEVIKNLKISINRLSKLQNIKTVNVEAQLINVIAGTTADTITTEIYKKISPLAFVKWMPSDAREIDQQHSLNYGKIMKLSTAKKKKLGIRIGCKCGMRFITQNTKMKQLQKRLKNIT